MSFENEEQSDQMLKFIFLSNFFNVGYLVFRWRFNVFI